jgi:hypothetical protein
VPNRLLREGICTSDMINTLSADEEVFFYRLLVICDDFGHADGRAAILKANCFPLRESASTTKIEAWINGLALKGMIRRYKHLGKPYLAIAKWEARIRTNPKHPLPDAENSEWIDSEVPHFDRNLSADCEQMAANGGLGKGKGKGKGATFQLPDDFGISESVCKWAQEKGIQNLERHFEYFVNSCKAKGYKYADWDRAFMNAVTKDWAQIGDGRKRVAT